MLFSARIKELENQVANLTTQLTQATEANSQCQVRFDADQAALANLTAELETARASLATVTGERDAAIATNTATAASIDAEVTRRLAAAGADPIARDPAPEPQGGNQTSAQIKATYAAIEDKETRFAFYQKHQTVLNS